jgi:integrase
MRASITESIIARLRAEERQPAEVWDTKVAGLLLRTYASGRAAWFIRAYTAAGKRTRIKLGEHPHLGVTEARRAALGQLAAVQQGRDPVAEKRAARAARRAALAVRTVEAAITAWQAARSGAAEGAWSPRYARAVSSALRVHIPAHVRSKPLPEVGRETWMGLISKAARDRPGAAAFLYTSVSSFLGYAEAMGWIEQHPLPRRGRSLVAPHPPARTRVLEDREWRAVWEAAEREPPKLRAFVRLLLLTATRLSETADIALGEIVSDRSIWVIPAGRVKNKREHIVPLCDLARHELRLVWPADEQAAGPEFRLLGRLPGRGFQGHGALLRRLQAASNTTNWTWHDLRRTARTTMTYLGVSEADAEAALNHVTRRGGLVGVYDRSGPPPSALTALRMWQGYVADVVTGRRPVGDAEERYRATLPEEFRHQSRQKLMPRSKAKPGRPRRALGPARE